MYTSYILFSKTADRYYIGFTGDDIQERIRKHCSNHKGYTGPYNDWVLVYAELFSTKTEAIRREKQLKEWKSRQKIEALIQNKTYSEHPDR